MSPVIALFALLTAIRVSPFDQRLIPAGEVRWTFSAATGSAYSLPLPLVIRQAGEPDIRLTAHYQTRPFYEVPYYDLRLARVLGSRAWELELVHHKLYLVNPPAGVNNFEITHGFNLITVNRAWTWRWLEVRAGAGIVLAHPQTTIRGLAFNTDSGFLGLGWFVSGGTVLGGVGVPVCLSNRLAAVFEAKVSAAYARVPVASGSADVANLAGHAAAGIRYRF